MNYVIEVEAMAMVYLVSVLFVLAHALLSKKVKKSLYGDMGAEERVIAFVLCPLLALCLAIDELVFLVLYMVKKISSIKFKCLLGNHDIELVRKFMGSDKVKCKNCGKFFHRVRLFNPKGDLQNWGDAAQSMEDMIDAMGVKSGPLVLQIPEEKFEAYKKAWEDHRGIIRSWGETGEQLSINQRAEMHDENYRKQIQPTDKRSS
jgi:hypothetical protein